VVDLVVLYRLLRATSKKGSQLFLRKKVHPPGKILATPMWTRSANPRPCWEWSRRDKINHETDCVVIALKHVGLKAQQKT